MRRAGLTIAAAAVLLAGCNRAASPDERGTMVDARKGAVLQHVGETPMAERVAVIGLLNKRNGIVRNLTMMPGQALRIRDVIVRLRACEPAAYRRFHPARRRATRPELATRVLGLALQGIAVAERRRTSGL